MRPHYKPDDQDDPYMTTGDAARVLGVSRPTVLSWAGKGQLKVVMIAGRPVVTRESVMKHPRAAQSAA